MKLLVSCLLIILSAFTAEASSVVWNIVSKEESGCQEFWVVTESRPYFWSIFNFSVTVSWNKATLTSNPDGHRILSYAGAWIEANCGDIVSAETTLHESSYFEYGILGDGIGIEEPVVVKVGETHYFKIVLQDADQCFDYQDGKRSEMPDCYYGWVEYSVDKNGNVSVTASAIDIAGNSMIVGGGAIPEPSSAVLLLLACAGLSLRRRNRIGRIRI